MNSIPQTGESKTIALWHRMQAAAFAVAARKGWREAAKLRRRWDNWFYRKLAQRWAELAGR